MFGLGVAATGIDGSKASQHSDQLQSAAIENAYRADLLVQNELIIELKSIDAFQPIHTAQLLTYLKLLDVRLGLLLNFKVAQMRNGIKRIVNNF